MIKAPYNFVPLAQKVVFPEWADQISIDLPFEDGISGTINVKYTAQTPVFIGNGKGDNNSAIPNYKAANGKYAIPGSSLRGMLRNVIEIASFGKFNRVSDAALSVRDLQNRELYINYFTKTKGPKEYEATSKAGWLTFENGIWNLYPVKYHRIEDYDIEQYYNLQKNSLESRTEFEKRIKPLKKKVEVYFTAGEQEPHLHHGGMKLVYSKVESINSKDFSGALKGFIVLVGQPGRRFNEKQNRKIGKHLDFIFENKGNQKLDVDNCTILKFKQANASKAADQKKGLNLPKKLNEYQDIGYPGIPVFYLTDENGKPESLGLSMMYRLPYKNSIHNAIVHSSELNFSDKMDFAECMFGKISNEKDMSLRGRVQFEDAITNSTSLAGKVDTVLGNPKPTYYPNYIQQNTKNSKYKTLMDDDVQLRGWKRYPVRDNTNPLPVGKDQKNVVSHFSPLQKGTVFEGKIHFHNLKQEELGALIWAITWGGNTELSHSVGMGKPYGFGQLKAEITSLIYLKNDAVDTDGKICNEYGKSTEKEITDWIDSFESYMSKKENIPNWKNSPQLKELLAMANPKNAVRPGWKLDYMNLGNKEFVIAKKREYKEFLAPYSSEKQEMHLSGVEGNNSNR